MAEWFTIRFIDEASLDLPGIYRWEIDGIEVYVGRYTRASRPLREYRNNVARIHDSRPYRRADPDGFRTIHRALAQAALERRQIELVILENCHPDRLNERERWHIAQLSDAHRLNGQRREREKPKAVSPPLPCAPPPAPPRSP
ncbi:MAG TPA: hypothetical protein VF440_01870 [Novosphingobium sp.]